MTVEYKISLTLKCNGKDCPEAITREVNSVGNIAPERWKMERFVESIGWVKLKRGWGSPGHYCGACLDKPIVPITRKK